jgi:putative heme-binding domain-containing protein
MGRTLAVLSSLMLLIPSTAWPQTRALSRALPAEVAAGKRIFDAQCAWCHGTGGSGGSGPNLQRVSLRHASSDASLVQIVRNGIPGTEMPNFAISLTDRMAWQAAAYVRSLARAAPEPVTGDRRRGAEVYQKAGCAACHVVSGEGGVVGPDLTAIGATRGPTYLRQSIVEPAASHPPGYLVARATSSDGREIRGILVNRDASGVVHTLEKTDALKVTRELDGTLMPSYASRLSSGEVDDLVSYLTTLRGER